MTPKEKTLIAGLGRGLKIGYYCDEVQENHPHEFRVKTVDYSAINFALKFGKPYLRDLSELKKNRQLLKELGVSEYRTEEEALKYPDASGYHFLIGNTWHKIEQLAFWQIEILLDHHFNVFALPETDYIKVTEQNNPY